MRRPIVVTPSLVGNLRIRIISIVMAIAAICVIALAGTATAFTRPLPTSTHVAPPLPRETGAAAGGGVWISRPPFGRKALSMGFSSVVSNTIQKIGGPVVAAGTAAATVGVATYGMKQFLDRPSRAYENGSVAREYDAWADDGILEYYWGEHIHLGYYSDEEMQRGYKKKDFKQAKFDFIDEMMSFGGIANSTTMGGDGVKILDVGCGFGGTSRYLAKHLNGAHVTGITLSPKQVQRADQKAAEQGLSHNTRFTVMNALDMSFPDNSFDVVWACESGEHMPDKRAYINEMIRVLKPGGKFVMATWCQRDDRRQPFDDRDLRDLQFLYDEWTHPHFISIEAYQELIDATGVMSRVTTADWVKETIASWRHMFWVSLYDPRGFIFKPRLYKKCVKDAYCLERMHRAFKRGLMQYGMFAATKKKKDT